jgi:hypothetical protein
MPRKRADLPRDATDIRSETDSRLVVNERPPSRLVWAVVAALVASIVFVAISNDDGGDTWSMLAP